MEDEQTYLTKEGFEKLNKELNDLKTVKRKEVAKRIYEAKELGDLSENAEYAEAKNEQSFIEGRIIELENILKTATLIDNNKQKKDSVMVGSTIIIKTDEGEKTYIIVGSNEANPLEGKISNVSPLGKAFIGKKLGESIDIEVPRGKKKVTIIDIN
ncbi:transcription elongation factor GreA [Patescibacteria group bacterium]